MNIWPRRLELLLYFCGQYTKIPKISPEAAEAYIFQRPSLRGLFLEGLIYGGKFGFNIDWATLINGRKFTVFALFYFVFEGNFEYKPPGGAYIWRGDLTEGFLRYEFGGLIFEGAYTNLRNFTVMETRRYVSLHFSVVAVELNMNAEE